MIICARSSFGVPGAAPRRRRRGEELDEEGNRESPRRTKKLLRRVKASSALVASREAPHPGDGRSLRRLT
jgi:hypothetical protein